MQCAATLSWNRIAPAARPKPSAQLRRDAAPPMPSIASHVRPQGLAIRPETRPESELLGGELPGGELLESDESQLVRRCMDGDSSAWAQMVRTHHKRVYGLCYRFTGNPADAEDVTQEVFLKIYSNLAAFNAVKGSLPVWIATVTRNLLVDNFRRTRNARVTSSLDEGWDSTEDLAPIDRLTSSHPSPHQAAARKELEKMVQAALAQVSIELREAVILRDLQDMDYKEIAQILNIPEGTVKSRISRGRAELARLLERNKREVM